jgi:hypothetical protein
LVCQILCSFLWHRRHFLPCLSARSQLCGSYLCRWCLGRGMYSFLCALGQQHLDGICICGPGDWNNIILVLLRFTVKAQVWQYLCRRSRCCCRPSLVGNICTRSSANSGHLTSDSSRVRPVAAACSSALANLLIYMLKRVGLKLHPYLTPRPCGKKY